MTMESSGLDGLKESEYRDWVVKDRYDKTREGLEKELGSHERRFYSLYDRLVPHQGNLSFGLKKRDWTEYAESDVNSIDQDEGVRSA